MEWITENKQLYYKEEIIKEKQRFVIIRNLESILLSDKKGFIFELFESISYGDNYSEEWGGVRYDSEDIESIIQKTINKGWERNSHNTLYGIDNFLIDVCIPVLDLLIENKMIKIEGYSVTYFSDSMLIGAVVTIKKYVKKGYYRKSGKIKSIDNGEYLISFEDADHYFNEKQFLFN